jgi:hypothetical protein
MSANKRRRTGTLVRKVFEILQSHPEGLHFSEILQLVQASQVIREDRDSRSARQAACSYEEVASGCIAPIKAGWLVSSNDVFVVSPVGNDAYTRYEDPAQFMVEAGRSSFRGWLSVYFPVFYYSAGKSLGQLIVEYQVLRRIGIRRLVRETFGPAKPWQDILPLQVSRRFVVPDLDLSDASSLVDYLQSLTVSYGMGRHAIYLPPQAVKGSAFRVLSEMYPPDAGLKIVKNQGGIEDSGYITGKTKGDSLIQLGLVHSHRHLSLVANLLYSKGIGPRLYDLVELQCNGSLWTAYVVEHMEGGTPSTFECEKVIKKLKDIEQEGLLKVILPDGFDDEEFDCPTCSGNTLTNHQGDCKYVDFQNFLLVNYQLFLTKIAVEASKNTHFGDQLRLRGGRYLYQSIPGVRMPGKRNVEERITVLIGLMESANVSVKDRLVLDVGCNIGMMMAQYLKLGAKWCHGWDHSQVTKYTEEILLALGCTRFSTSGTDIIQSQDLEGDLPSFLASSLNGCIISYLAVRGHLGWLDALSRIPWSFLIYEGHEGESQEDFENHIAQLKRLTNCHLGGVSNYVDGDSEQRTVALLLRKVA